MPEDRLKVVVYKEIIYDDYNLHIANNPGFDPSIEEWQENFNEVIKQGVINMGNVIKDSLGNAWDYNSNGKFDHIIAVDLLQNTECFFRDEYLLLLADANELTSDSSCYNNTNSASFIVKNDFITHWVLMEDPVSDYDGEYRNLVLHTTYGLEMGIDVNIAKYSNPTIYEELTVLDAKPPDTIMIGLRNDITKGLQNIYHASDEVTIFSTEFAGGLTQYSCACSRDESTYGVHIHEFLHEENVGPLYDVIDICDTNNIMYYHGLDRTGKKLRYRELSVTPVNPEQITRQSQWEYLHNN